MKVLKPSSLSSFYDNGGKEKGLLSEVRKNYIEYLKKSLENREDPLRDHLEEIKKKTNFFFYRKKGNLLDIYF